MLELFRKKDFTQTMLKHFILISLFFPVFSSRYQSGYAPDLIFANIFALMATLGLFLQNGFNWRKNRVWLCLLALLACYNASAFYANFKQLNWYGSQLNITIPFLFFFALASAKTPCEDASLLRFLLRAIVISNFIGVVIYCLNYYGISFMNLQIGLIPVDPAFYERRFNWIYLHKSQYAFMLVLFLALIVTYRHLFTKKWTYYASVCLMAAGLLISHTYTSMAAALLIFVGLLLDHFRIRSSGFKLKYLLWFVPVLLVGLGLLAVIASHRNLATLGSRLPIWRGMINVIRENPYGTGQICGLIDYELPGLSFAVSNCHNVFLNFMLQFSIPAGLCCIAMIGFLLLVSVKRNLSFTTLGIWAALLIPMMMDWCMLLTELPMFLLCLYFLFFSPVRNSRNAEAQAEAANV